MQALKPLEIVQVVKATKRIPDDLRYTHPYSAIALWTFYARTHHEPVGETCEYCSMFDGQTFRGDQLRILFPNHRWEGSDIYPDVHKTLWGKEDTCACLLIREPTMMSLELDMWSDLGVDWWELEFTE
jgi:hypothetical protein